MTGVKAIRQASSQSGCTGSKATAEERRASLLNRRVNLSCNADVLLRVMFCTLCLYYPSSSASGTQANAPLKKASSYSEHRKAMRFPVRPTSPSRSMLSSEKPVSNNGLWLRMNVPCDEYRLITMVVVGQ